LSVEQEGESHLQLLVQPTSITFRSHVHKDKGDEVYEVWSRMS